MSDPTKRNLPINLKPPFRRFPLESMSKVIRATSTFTPDSAPPELLRPNSGTGSSGAHAEAWNEFLRSPCSFRPKEPTDGQAVAFRRETNEFMAKARKEMQAPTGGGIDGDHTCGAPHGKHVRSQLVEELAGQPPQRQSRAGPARARSASRRRALKVHGSLRPEVEGRPTVNATGGIANPWLQWQQAAVDETINAARRMRWLLPSLLARHILKGVTPSEVVYGGKTGSSSSIT